jgi:hypothetical protein
MRRLSLTKQNPVISSRHAFPEQQSVNKSNPNMPQDSDAMILNVPGRSITKVTQSQPEEGLHPAPLDDVGSQEEGLHPAPLDDVGSQEEGLPPAGSQ